MKEYNVEKFQILVYENINVFYNQFISDNVFERTYYSIFFHKKRYLYLDIDHYHINKCLSKDPLIVVKHILNALLYIYNAMKNKKTITIDNFYVFDSSRSCKQKGTIKYKLSLHIYCPKIIYNAPKDIVNDIMLIKKISTQRLSNLSSKDIHQQFALKALYDIDESIYKDIQYLRLCRCFKKNILTSQKRLIFPTNCTLNVIELIKICQADIISSMQNTLTNKFNVKKPTKIHNEYTHLIKKESNYVYKNNKSTSKQCQNKYIFHSTANNLKWEEIRIQNIITSYHVFNSTIIKYPRCYLNLYLPIKELEK